MTFRIKRTETIQYWIDYDRSEVLDMLSMVKVGWIDADVRAEYDEMDDDELANELGMELRSGSPATELVIEQSERHADVQGSDFEVYSPRMVEA